MTTKAHTERHRPLIAPLWHLGVLVAVIVGVAVLGAALHMKAREDVPGASRILHDYLPLIAVEWGLAIYVCMGRPSMLRKLLGDFSLRHLARDLLIGLVGWGLLRALDLLLPHPEIQQSLLPGDLLEKLAWVPVALSAAFCEEVVYRGYLQRQFAALIGFKPAAIVLQAALFGVAHGYQGAWPCVQIALTGAALGAVAMLCRSLRPGIICHALVDLVLGLTA